MCVSFLPSWRAARPGGGDGLQAWGPRDNWTHRGPSGRVGACSTQRGKALLDGRGQLASEVLLQLLLGAGRSLPGGCRRPLGKRERDFSPGKGGVP